MYARLALFTAFCAAVMGGLALQRRRPVDVQGVVRRVGRSAARSVSEDWDSLFI